MSNKEHIDLAKTKTVATATITVSLTLMFFMIVITFTSWLQHQEFISKLPYIGIFYLLANSTLLKYQKDKMDSAKHALEHQVDDLLTFLFFVKDSNAKGITVQDLERKGLLKMTLQTKIQEEEKIRQQKAAEEHEIDSLIIDKLTKKEKLPN